MDWLDVHKESELAVGDDTDVVYRPVKGKRADSCVCWPIVEEVSPLALHIEG